MAGRGVDRGRLSWGELNAYTTAKFALRYINQKLAETTGAGKKEILRKTGEFVIEAMDAMADTNADQTRYSELFKKGNEVFREILDEGLHVQKKEGAKPDLDFLEIRKCVTHVSKRLAELKLDLEKELPDDYLNFRAAIQFSDEIEENAQKNASVNLKAAAKDFLTGHQQAMEVIKQNREDIRKKLVKTRKEGAIDRINDAAYEAASAINHAISGLWQEQGGNKIELYKRCPSPLPLLLLTGWEGKKAKLYGKCANLADELYKAITSDDPLYSSRRLFESEKRVFLSSRGPPPEELSWELDTMLRKLDEYERLADAACAYARDVAKSELVGSGLEADLHLLQCVAKLSNISREMLYSSVLLFENQFVPAQEDYAKLDEAKTNNCVEAKKRVDLKIAELSALYGTSDMLVKAYGGKRVSEGRFNRVYDDMRKIATSGGDVDGKMARYVTRQSEAV